MIKNKLQYIAWLPQSSYPCGNFSDTSSLEFLRSNLSLGRALTIRIRTGNHNQTSFYPSNPHDFSILVELILGHLRYLLTDVSPQLNSPLDNVFPPNRPAKRVVGAKIGDDEAFGYLKRVIVTPAVYPRIVEFRHFDI
ncbi:uncharacterized protein [Solanum tuberosum]|uniref:uncharacterized protein n=1 Tax=Solanum tuberosum TaxID=4113 RepID=UPI00073A443F|nr:PREDICTED: uncharacterized protein LOC107058152 [Solanum tuberosum]